jgi:hypothetical protein
VVWEGGGREAPSYPDYETKFRSNPLSMWDNKAFTENELSFVGKAAVIILLVVPVFFITVRNIIIGEVANPYAFTICIVGFLLFLISKISLFRKGVSFSFGTKRLSENMGNLYRLGYWLMAVGLIITFFN